MRTEETNARSGTSGVPTDSAFEVGDIVLIHGLKSATQYNDICGIIKKAPGNDERVAVEVCLADEPIKVKTRNLRRTTCCPVCGAATTIEHGCINCGHALDNDMIAAFLSGVRPPARVPSEFTDRSA